MFAGFIAGAAAAAAAPCVAEVVTTRGSIAERANPNERPAARRATENMARWPGSRASSGGDLVHARARARALRRRRANAGDADVRQSSARRSVCHARRHLVSVRCRRYFFFEFAPRARARRFGCSGRAHCSFPLFFFFFSNLDREFFRPAPKTGNLPGS